MHQHPLIRHELARERQLDRLADGARSRATRQAEPDERAARADAEAVAALVRAATRGDERAWRTLIERFTPAVRTAARGFRLTSSDVDDVVQSTWLAAYRNLPRIHKPEAIGAWLIVTARREAMRTVQRGAREIVADSPPTAVAPERDAPERLVVETERHDALHAAARRLPGRHGALLAALLTAPGASYEELSLQLEIPVGSIGPTRKRAFARLRRDRRLSDVVGKPGV